MHECCDLSELGGASNAKNNGPKRYVVKLMSNPDLWVRELQTRDALGTSNAVLGAVSAAMVDQLPVANGRALWGKARRGHVAKARRGGPAPTTHAAKEYAAKATSDSRPVTIFQPLFVSEARRDEARQLMSEYPFAIQMSLADRNLNEIIASERLAEEPLDVIRESGRKLLNLIQDLHNDGIVHGDVKPKNVVRADRTLKLIDLDMAIKLDAGSSEPPAHANPEKFNGSTAYAAPELHRWMAEHEAGTSPLDRLKTPHQVDLWSYACTLYEMATGSALFQNSYDRATPAALAQLHSWTGLNAEHMSQIELLHGTSESATLQDVLLWGLDAHAASRPQSVGDLATHAFFEPRRGAMRENFVVSHIKQLLLEAPTKERPRLNVNVMISYSWSDSNFVLSRLVTELAPHVQDLWLDRLGGEQGMGEFAQASMQRGVKNADVIIAVVSQAYIASTNCGYEMELAHANGKPVIPIVLNVPFQEWPPKQIGQTRMANQFATEAGDVKIFIDMSDGSMFFQKFQNELLPRLMPGGFDTLLPGDASHTMINHQASVVGSLHDGTSGLTQGGELQMTAVVDEVELSTQEAILASDSVGSHDAARTIPSRPKKKNKVGPVLVINGASEVTPPPLPPPPPPPCLPSSALPAASHLAGPPRNQAR